MIIVFTSCASDFVPERALPIFGYGPSNTFLSGLSNLFAFSSTFILALMMPLIGDGKRLKKIGIISLIIYFVYLMMGVIALLFIFPSITEINNTLSIYILTRNVNFGDFIQRIDAIFILFWIMSIFSYLAIVMYFLLNSFKKITNIKQEKAMVYGFSALMFIISMLPKNIADIKFFENTFYRYASIVFVFFLTMTILICAYFKKKRELKKGDLDIEKAT